MVDNSRDLDRGRRRFLQTVGWSAIVGLAASELTGCGYSDTNYEDYSDRLGGYADSTYTDYTDYTDHIDYRDYSDLMGYSDGSYSYPDCSDGQVFDWQTGECVDRCKQGYTRDNETGECIPCEEGEYCDAWSYSDYSDYWDTYEDAG